MNNIRIHSYVSGHVQGVGFRYFVHQNASSLRLTGWVRNLPSGQVEIMAEGNEESINQLLETIQNAPRPAKVDDIKTELLKYTNEWKEFRISFF